MYCLTCAEDYHLPTESEQTRTRCIICGEVKICYSEKVADRKLLMEPREAIKNEIRRLNSELEALQPYIDKFNSLFTRRTRLREEHLRLEHLLTNVKVQVVKASCPTFKPPPNRTAKSVIKSLSDEERKQLIAYLEKEG